MLTLQFLNLYSLWCRRLWNTTLRYCFWSCIGNPNGGRITATTDGLVENAGRDWGTVHGENAGRDCSTERHKTTTCGIAGPRYAGRYDTI